MQISNEKEDFDSHEKVKEGMIWNVEAEGTNIIIWADSKNPFDDEGKGELVFYWLEKQNFVNATSIRKGNTLLRGDVLFLEKEKETVDMFPNAILGTGFPHWDKTNYVAITGGLLEFNEYDQLNLERGGVSHLIDARKKKFIF